VGIATIKKNVVHFTGSELRLITREVCWIGGRYEHNVGENL